MSTEDVNVRLGADLGSLHTGMNTAGQVVDSAASQITAAINAMSAATTAAVAAMHRSLDANFQAMAGTVRETGTAAQQMGQNVEEAGNIASRPLSDSTRDLRRGARDTTSAINELQSAMGQMLTLAAVVKIVNDSVEAYNRAESALYGLASAARYTGNDFNQVMEASKRLTQDGLLGTTEASKGLQNLLMRGFGLEEATAMMERFKDSAAYNRQASLSFGDAVVSATEGLKNENSVLVDNAGVTKNVSQMWKEYAAEHQISVDKMTIAEKRQAEYNGIMKETEGQVGNAAKMSKLFSGELAKARQEAEQTKAEFGQAMIPTLAALLRAMRPVWEMTRDFVGGFQMMTVSIAGFVDKAAAIYDAGGILGLMFSADARAKVREQFKVIDQAVAEQKEEIFKTLTSPVAFNPDMLGKGGPTRKDPTAPPEEAGPKESKMSLWKSELEAKKEAEGDFLRDSKSMELEFWEAKGRMAKKGSDEARGVAHEVYRLKKEMAKEELQEQLADISLRVEREQAGSTDRVKIWEEGVKRIKDAYGEDSKEFKQALQKKEALQREHAQTMAQLADVATETTREIARINLDIEAQNFEHRRRLGATNAEEEVGIAMDLATRKAIIEIDALEEKLAREKIGTVEYQKLLGQIEIAEAKHQQKIGEIQKRAALDQSKTFDTIMDSVESSFSSAIQGMLKGSMKLRDGIKTIASGILKTFMDLGIKMLFDWVKRQVAMTAVTTTQEAARTTAAATGETTRTTLAITGATTQVAANAVSAASGAASSQAGIPYVGPILAAVAMAAMLAMVLGLGSNIKSASGGWDRIDKDQVAQVHKDEMILPAELAENVRGMTGNAARPQEGTTGPIMISAVDARGVKRLLSDNGGAMASVLQKQARNFRNTGIKPKGRG